MILQTIDPISFDLDSCSIYIVSFTCIITEQSFNLYLTGGWELEIDFKRKKQGTCTKTVTLHKMLSLYIFLKFKH